ncbi:hypothetical protein SAMN05216466_13731 [Paraburkholderia phenazinium]|uniref:Uncharacterized protein n=1 Tax=Paraburkholderia phenazinium TaxID=60549 RepID=A0A1G8NU45_9BURK|nr:hypothetical protein SAMN05216466_13731 [Paraburkholderia phenazinium]
MVIPYNLDDEARNELLTYLVASQLVARARSGEWLTLEHVCESASLWLNANGGNCDVVERARLGEESLRVASDVLVFPIMKDPEFLTRMFTDGWRLDYRSPIVRCIFDVCAHHRLGPLDVQRESRHRK